MACRSDRPRQEDVNRFVFLGKKIRIPTRGWAVQRARSGRQKMGSTLLSGQPRRWDLNKLSWPPAGGKPGRIHHLKGQVTDLTQMACRSVKPMQRRVNRFVFLGKKIRIPTRGWAVQRARGGRQKRESTLLSGQPRRSRNTNERTKAISGA